LQAEIDAVLGDFSLDELMASEVKEKAGRVGSRRSSWISATRRAWSRWDRESIFFTIGGQHEAIAARRQFEELPEVGATLFEVVPTRYSGGRQSVRSGRAGSVGRRAGLVGLCPKACWWKRKSPGTTKGAWNAK
jgi:hypothetical protein